MAIPRSVIEALPERDRHELARWAAMAGMSAEAYLEACIRKGYQIIGRQVLGTPTFMREKYPKTPAPLKPVARFSDAAKPVR